MVKKLRILIVDDQKHARRSLRALLAAQFGWIEMLEADDGIEAVRCVEEWEPDIVLMDARMPEMDGVEATRIINMQAPQVRVIMFSMYGEYRAAGLAAGAKAFISKGEPPEQLLATVTALCSTN